MGGDIWILAGSDSYGVSTVDSPMQIHRQME